MPPGQLNDEKGTSRSREVERLASQRSEGEDASEERKKKEREEEAEKTRGRDF